MKKQFAPGDEIFKEGDPAEAAYVIASGEVEIVKELEGAEVILARLGSGEIFGEMGLVDDKPRSASARAVGEVSLECMSHEHFMYVLVHRPKEAISYLKVLFERLRTVNAMLSVSDLPAPPVETDKPVLIRLLPDSPEANRFLPEEGLDIDRLPFRFGRAHSDPMATNDFVVVDQEPFSVSRYHFMITRDGSEFIVRDRGSYLGTVVNGEGIGGKRAKGQAPLNPGDNTLAAGKGKSPFRFKVVVL
ncbi:MAG: cyclic nucleotide-binding domain-containing protein [Myxococcota bacterium]